MPFRGISALQTNLRQTQITRSIKRRQRPLHYWTQSPLVRQKESIPYAGNAETPSVAQSNVAIHSDLATLKDAATKEEGDIVYLGGLELGNIHRRSRQQDHYDYYP